MRSSSTRLAERSSTKTLWPPHYTAVISPPPAVSAGLISPHLAGTTDVMLAGTLDYLARVVDNLVAGKKPQSVLNAPTHPRRALS